MKKIFPLVIIILSITVGYFLADNYEKESFRLSRSAFILGTLVEIQIEDDNKKIVNEAIDTAFDEIKRIDSVFSIYNKNSIVSTINNGVQPIQNINDEIYKIIEISDTIWKKSSGAFDATLYNLIDVWRFNSDSPSLPDEEKLKQALKSSGWENVEFHGGNSIHLKNGVKFNFNGIAKGYAVDRAISKLKYVGIDKAIVNAGGEIRTYGDIYIIGIQNPRNADEILAKLRINNKAVSTSGDYEKYFILGGKRYHHILNPKTGIPASECTSVTIISDNCTIADAYSTAVFVLGKEKGLELIEGTENVEGVIIDISGKIHFSSGFAEYIIK